MILKYIFVFVCFEMDFTAKKWYLIITHLWNLRPINWLQKS